ncbi:MAG TPA: hypothetical protein VFW23_07865 [Tepidisphaeraceae bacterium]|nr:hypothetical protein [Tepidisphaeraceae bacterium]
MRRALRMIWHGMAITAAIAVVALAILELRGFDLRFHRHGQAWRLNCNQGVFHLGNVPQITLEAERSEAARDARTRINEAREAPLRQILRHEAWRSQAYQVALIKLNQLKEVEADEALQAIAMENASRSPAVEHAIPAYRLILIATALFAVWVTIQTFSWMRRLRRAGWTRGQLAATGLAHISAVFFLALGYLWIRSNYVDEDLNYVSRGRQGAEFKSSSLSVPEGNLLFYHSEEVFLNRKFYEQELARSKDNPRFSELSWPTGLMHRSTWAFPYGQRPPFWRRLRFAFFTRSASQSRIDLPPARLSPPTRFFLDPWTQPVYTSIAIEMPIWPLMLVSAIWPILWLRKMRRHFFAGPNRCRGCGYDLRASPDRCPECGLVRAAAN